MDNFRNLFLQMSRGIGMTATSINRELKKVAPADYRSARCEPCLICTSGKPKWPARPMRLSLFQEGMGTMEELLEVVTWAQLRIHKKPVGLLNVDGSYNSLLSFFDKAVDEGFISPISRRIIISAPTAKELVLQLEEYETEYDEVTAKLVWDEVDRLGFVPTVEG